MLHAPALTGVPRVTSLWIELPTAQSATASGRWQPVQQKPVLFPRRWPCRRHVTSHSQSLSGAWPSKALIRGHLSGVAEATSLAVAAAVR